MQCGQCDEPTTTTAGICGGSGTRKYHRAEHGEIENPSYTPLKLQAPSTPFRRTYCTQDFGCMYTGGAGEAAEGRPRHALSVAATWSMMVSPSTSSRSPMSTRLCSLGCDASHSVNSSAVMLRWSVVMIARRSRRVGEARKVETSPQTSRVST